MKLPLNSRRYHPPSLSTPLLHNRLLAAKATQSRGDINGRVEQVLQVATT